VVVISELDTCLLTGLSGPVESIGGALPDIRLFAEVFRDPGTDDVALADDLGRLDLARPLIAQNIPRNMAGGRDQTVAVDGGPHFFGRVIEISRKFDFLIADRGNFSERTVEVSFHEVAHTVQLHAEVFDLVVRCGPANSARQQRSSGNGGGGLKERTAIHHGISPTCFGTPTIIRRKAQPGWFRMQNARGTARADAAARGKGYFDETTCRLLVTEKMPETLLARIPATFLSP
jgi:hypothetical protein